VGCSDGDMVGSGGVTALSNGNYIVRRDNWCNGEGAVSFGSGTTGVAGMVTSANSLVGSSSGDGVGNGGIVALNNGNYVVRSQNWSGATGAVTFGNGTAGV